MWPKRRSSFAKLAQFLGFGHPSPAPPRFPPSFASSSGCAIGLGIVAAMDASKPPAIATALSPTEPLAVVAPTTDAVDPSEIYTSVISYRGGCPVERGIYSGEGVDDRILVDEVVLFELPTPGELVLPPSQVGELLRRCFRCKKELDGLDIYMYRGEKAFCSLECRCHHVSLEELKSHQHSLPPCSAPPRLAAEVVMA